MTMHNRTKNTIAIAVEIIFFAITIYTAYTFLTDLSNMFFMKIIIILVSMSIASITFCMQFDFSMDLAYGLIFLTFSIMVLLIPIFT